VVFRTRLEKMAPPGVAGDAFADARHVVVFEGWSEDRETEEMEDYLVR
jgi:hypothetical protein